MLENADYWRCQLPDGAGIFTMNSPLSGYISQILLPKGAVRNAHNRTDVGHGLSEMANPQATENTSFPEEQEPPHG